MRVVAARMSCPADMRNCSCGCIPEECSEASSSRQVQKTGRSTAEAEASRLEREQMDHSSCNVDPLIDGRTGARHADVRLGPLGGLWNRHGLKRPDVLTVTKP
jgi:hypothetical protein